MARDGPTAQEESVAERFELCADGALPVRAACTFCGCGRTLMYEAIARGELPVVKHGRKTAIPRRALVAWMARRMNT